MKVSFVDIPTTTREYKIEETSWFPYDEFALDAPTEVGITLQRKNETTVVLCGKIVCKIGFLCDCCCEQTYVKVDSTFSYVVKKEEDSSYLVQEKECTDEDVNTLYSEGSEIEIGAILCEQLYLAIPDSRRCSENCKGLCHICGTNLNFQECDCGKHNENSPFAVLGKLKK